MRYEAISKKPQFWVFEMCYNLCVGSLAKGKKAGQRERKMRQSEQNRLEDSGYEQTYDTQRCLRCRAIKGMCVCGACREVKLSAADRQWHADDYSIETAATKKWLKQMTFLDTQLESKTKELMKMCNLRTGLIYASVTAREMIDEIITRLNGEIELLLRQRIGITETIAKVESQGMRIALEERYIHNASINLIAQKIRYSSRQTKRLMEAAILVVAKKDK